MNSVILQFRWSFKLRNYQLHKCSIKILGAMNKVVANADEAIRDVFDGATIMIGGFGLCGMPENLIRALVRKGTKNLHTISNNVGIDGVGNGLLLAAGQIVHHIGTYVGENKLLEEMVLKGRSSWTWFRKGHFQRGFAQVARGFRPFIRRRAWEPSSQKARRRASSMAGRT